MNDCEVAGRRPGARRERPLDFVDAKGRTMYCDHVVVLHTGRVHACGAPGDVLTEELIAEVYGVRAAVSREGAEGRPHVRFLGTLV